MRTRPALVLALALATASCAIGSGVGTTTSTSAPTTTSTTTTLPALDPADRSAAADAAANYLGAWAAFDWDLAARFVVDPPSSFASTHQAWVDGLRVASVAFTVGDIRPAESGEGAFVSFTADVEVRGAGTWEYQGGLPVVHSGTRWLVDWSPAAIHPALEEGDTLRVVATWSTRGALLAIDGRPIAADHPVKVIEVTPGRVTDLDALLAGLEQAAGLDPTDVLTDIEAPGVQPDSLVAVGSLSTDDYPAVAAQLAALEGVSVEDGTQRSHLPSPFADHVVGTTGAMTADLLQTLGPPYAASDTVGISGLERALERRLAGIPYQEVQRVDKEGRVVETLTDFPGIPPEDVTTTLDIDVQQAVEAVISTAPEPAAIVVLDVATGGIRGIASRPLEAFDRALGGLYPPGSTFKVITAAALLAEGVTPLQLVDCPSEVTVGGRSLTNAGGQGRGEITFADAFAYSCNTVFAPLAVAMLGPGELAATAATFGFGTAPDLPLPASTAVFPEPIDDAEKAMAAIGQGRVLASPLAMATVAAAVAGGGWRPPALLAGTAPDPRPFDAEVDGELADLMLRVVTYGTGTAAAVAGEEVRGKTGTAEYGTATPPDSHAWFIGYWEGYAFAVLVEGGGSGGTVAAPLAADLVERLAAPG
jgi:cell division protein FtsI/penicillin-binding protein 2